MWKGTINLTVKIFSLLAVQDINKIYQQHISWHVLLLFRRFPTVKLSTPHQVNTCCIKITLTVQPFFSTKVSCSNKGNSKPINNFQHK